MRRISLILAALLLTGFGTACATAWDDPMGYRADFEEIQAKFTKFIRWGAIDEASAFVAREQRDDFLDLAPELTDMRFTDYEILYLDYGEDDESATVKVRYSGYRLSYPVEKSFRVTQEWEKDPESGAWTVRLDVAQIRDALAASKP